MALKSHFTRDTVAAQERFNILLIQTLVWEQVVYLSKQLNLIRVLQIHVAHQIKWLEPTKTIPICWTLQHVSGNKTNTIFVVIENLTVKTFLDEAILLYIMDKIKILLTGNQNEQVKLYMKNITQLSGLYSEQWIPVGFVPLIQIYLTVDWQIDR